MLLCSAKLVSSVVAAATNPLDGELHALDEHKVIYPHDEAT